MARHFQAMPVAQAPPPANPAVAVVQAQVEPLTVTGVKPGVAHLSCTIRWSRSIDRCVVLDAEPARCGFGTAALRLVEHMKLDAQAAARARNGKVEIPLSFTGVGGCPRPDTP